MSFLIAVHVNEGIVLASDRRTTYTNTQTCGDTIIQRIGIHTTNSTDKTFPCPNGAGISTCGDASLLGKPITGFIQDMIRSRIGDDCPVSSIPQSDPKKSKDLCILVTPQSLKKSINIFDRMTKD